jgi:hypothetical protein
MSRIFSQTLIDRSLDCGVVSVGGNSFPLMSGTGAYDSAVDAAHL